MNLKCSPKNMKDFISNCESELLKKVIILSDRVIFEPLRFGDFRLTIYRQLSSSFYHVVFALKGTIDKLENKEYYYKQQIQNQCYTLIFEQNGEMQSAVQYA